MEVLDGAGDAAQMYSIQSWFKNKGCSVPLNVAPSTSGAENGDEGMGKASTSQTLKTFDTLPRSYHQKWNEEL